MGCYLKGQVLGTYDHEGCVARVKTGVLSDEKSRAQCSRFSSADDYDGYDVSGVLLAQSVAASSAECCPLCEASSECEAFAFLDSTCYLKGNFTGVYRKAGVTSRVMAGVGAGCPGFSAAQEGKDLAGALLDSWYSPESRLCCAACSAKSDCDVLPSWKSIAISRVASKAPTNTMVAWFGRRLVFRRQ